MSTLQLTIFGVVSSRTQRFRLEADSTFDRRHRIQVADLLDQPFGFFVEFPTRRLVAAGVTKTSRSFSVVSTELENGTIVEQIIVEVETES
jgi:hypothetical protein